MLVCIATQTVAMVPHHHHVDSLAFCIDCVHLGESADEECSCSDHDTIPEDQDPLGCSSQEMVVTAPETSFFKSEILCTDHHVHCLHCACLPCCAATAAALDNCKAEVIIDGLDDMFVPQRYLDCISTALPPRAPDFMG